MTCTVVAPLGLTQFVEPAAVKVCRLAVEGAGLYSMPWAQA
jgi:hypothetical protein